MGRTLSRKDVADFFGCSLPTVDVWIKEGLPVKGGGSKGVAWEIDSVEAHQWLVKKARSTRRTRGNRYGEGEEGAEGAMSYDDARARHEVAKMKKAELDLAEALEKVAPIDVIAKVVSDEIANARARILAIPSKFRPSALMHAASAEKAKKLVAEIDELLRDALTEIKTHGAQR